MGLFGNNKKPNKNNVPLTKKQEKKARKASEAKRKRAEFDEMAFWINVLDDDDLD